MTQKMKFISWIIWKNRSDEGPTLEMSTFQLFMVTNLSYQLNNTKLPRYTLPPTKRTVSLETYPIYLNKIMV